MARDRAARGMASDGSSERAVLLPSSAPSSTAFQDVPLGDSPRCAARASVRVTRAATCAAVAAGGRRLSALRDLQPEARARGGRWCTHRGGDCRATGARRALPRAFVGWALRVVGPQVQARHA